MTFFDQYERRFGWLAFPGFLRFYALFHVLVFVLQLIRPDLYEILAFDRTKILSGEIWRVVTMFFAISQFGGMSVMSIIFLFCAVSFVFMVSDGLENQWGSFATSLFYYTGILLMLIANFALPFHFPGSGTLLYLSAFFAFATLFPKVEILLFFVIPVQIRFLGFLAAAGVLLAIIASPIASIFYVIGLVNYLIWAGIPALRGTVRVIESGQRKRRFNSMKIDPSDAFHTCVICHRNDVEDPEVEFRIGADGREYCEEHLPK
ncbi:MAG: hypothetical protein HC845_07965 [Akkermansiaceae bacterium]|nr:hypothetical protein [Akkermansiaceae bacterium]